MPKNTFVHLGLGFVALLYAINYIIAKDIMPKYIQPFGLIFIRVSGATLLFWLLSLSRKSEKIEKKDFIRLVLCALFGVAINQLLFFKGLSLSNPINASIIITTTPILVLVFSAFLLSEKITLKKMIGIALGLIGAFFLIGGTNINISNQTAWGDILIFINAISYACYLVLVKPLMKKYQAMTVVQWVFLIGFLFIIPFGYQELLEVHWSTLPMYAYLIMFYIVVAVTFLAYLINAWSLKFVNASVVGFYIYLQPILTTILAIVLGRDGFNWSKVLFSLMIFLGVHLVTGAKKKQIKH